MTHAKPRVLVAGTELAIATCQRILDEEAQVVAARSVAQALERLEPAPDLIISSVRFDESRMFDFLQALQEFRDRCRAPVVCCRIVPKPLSPAIYQSIETAAAALGVKAFFDMETEIRRHGEAEAGRRLRHLIHTQLALREVT
jgi:response regulator RpfG family c-di-GMP phosphodiesterase